MITTPGVDSTLWATFTDRNPVTRVLLVAGTAGPPSDDAPLVDRWEANGFEVTVIDDDALVSATVAEGYDLVWVSSTVNFSLVGDIYALIDTPLGMHEGYLYEDNLLGTSGRTEIGSQRLGSATSQRVHRRGPPPAAVVRAPPPPPTPR